MPRAWFSRRDDFNPLWTSVMSGDTSGCHSGIWVGKKGAGIGISWVEVRDTAKCPTMHKTVPYNKILSGLKSQ